MFRLLTDWAAAMLPIIGMTTAIVIGGGQMIPTRGGTATRAVNCTPADYRTAAAIRGDTGRPASDTDSEVLAGRLEECAAAAEQARQGGRTGGYGAQKPVNVRWTLVGAALTGIGMLAAWVPRRDEKH